MSKVVTGLQSNPVTAHEINNKIVYTAPHMEIMVYRNNTGKVMSVSKEVYVNGR